ncbi:MAG: STAS domain-containing protein [Acidobacteria bacterium]|nr:STAS domain-containing protein [Acidobacteriota bacterium]
MPDGPLTIQPSDGPAPGQRTWRLSGPLTLANLFDFQRQLRSESSSILILDFTEVPYVDSAGIGALVGSYVSRKGKGQVLALVGVSKRVHEALRVTQVEQLFTFYDSIAAAAQA